MKTNRVPLLIGNKMYHLVTTMSDDRVHKVSELLAEVVAGTDPRLDQDERLFLASMTLASSLQTIKEQLETVFPEVEP